MKDCIWDMKEEEVSDSDIGRLREWYSYQRPWSRESRSISKAEAGRSVAWMDNGKSLDQLLWNTGGSTQRRLEGLSGSRRASLMFPNIDLPFEKSHSHGSVDFPQPHLALQVQKPSKWTVGSTPAWELARPALLKVKGCGREIPTWAMLGIKTCPVI